MEEKHTVGLPVGLLTPGRAYKFKYRAINIFGEGAFSQESTVIAAMKPDKIATPTQEHVNRDLRLTWVEPNIRGDAITTYNVFVKAKSGNFVEYQACQSSSLICSIAMSDMHDLAEDYVLVEGDTIWV